MAKLLDSVTLYMTEHRIPLTQNGWININWLGERESIDDLCGEELADLPDGFENWPVDEEAVVRGSSRKARRRTRWRK